MASTALACCSANLRNKRLVALAIAARPPQAGRHVDAGNDEVGLRRRGCPSRAPRLRRLARPCRRRRRGESSGAELQTSTSGSIGLAIWSFMPASRHFSRSDAMAFAVIAMIGKRPEARIDLLTRVASCRP